MPPPQLLASSPSNDSIIVSWEAVANAVQYTLSTHHVGTNTSVRHNTSSTNLTISGLDAASLYAIEGFAWDPEGRAGEASLIINQTTRKEALRHFFIRSNRITFNKRETLATSCYLYNNTGGRLYMKVKK